MSTYVENPQSRPVVNLRGRIDNTPFDAVHVLNLCKNAAQKAGWTKAQIDDFLSECSTSDHRHAERVIRKHFDVQ